MKWNKKKRYVGNIYDGHYKNITILRIIIILITIQDFSNIALAKNIKDYPHNLPNYFAIFFKLYNGISFNFRPFIQQYCLSIQIMYSSIVRSDPQKSIINILLIYTII